MEIRLQPLTHDEVVGLWETAGPEAAWKTRVLAQPRPVRRLLLAIADSRYIEGEEEAARSRAVYATLESDLDPGTPEDAGRVKRLFDGPLSVPWPMELVRRGYRHAADRDTEVRCGLLHAQTLLLGGDRAEAEDVALSVYRRVAGTAAEGEGAALLVLERAAWLSGSRAESLFLAGEAVRWNDRHGSDWWRVLAWQHRVEALVVVGALDEARSALATLSERIDGLADEREPRARASARQREAAVLLFSGEPEAAIAALREARVALAAAGIDDDSYYDVEVDTLRRLGRLPEAAEALAPARLRAKTPEQSVHVAALEAGLAVASGRVDDALRLVETLSADPTRRIAAGLRLAALEYVLDAIPDDPRFVAVVERAAPLLADAIAVRIGEVARFDSLVYQVTRAAADDLPLVRRLADPFGRRSLQPWLSAREAVSASERVTGLLRLDGRRVVACASCGRVATRRQGWLPIGSLLPHLDGDVSRVPACTTCAPSADGHAH